MSFHPVIMAIVDTPQFQRLRDLHQLGNSRYLFPGATHTRFEHSLGVCHLATRMLMQLRANHDVGPALDITPIDVLCVSIAGLCHDLGHGPLSHMFETFVARARALRGESGTPWAHEDASVQMLDWLVNTNGIDLSKYHLVPCDMEFVRRLIVGLRPDEEWPEAAVGRPPTKRFLFDIVANKRNGVDVDKLDYFLRDSMGCYGKRPSELHVDRIFNAARALSLDGQWQVCFEEKLALTLSELFTLRVRLHKFVYQHRIVKVLDEMTLQALLLAEDGFRVVGPDGPVPLSRAVESMEVFESLGDWIFCAILASRDPVLAEARALLRRIRTRQLYTLVGYHTICAPDGRPRHHDTPPNRRAKSVWAVQPVTSLDIANSLPGTLATAKDIFVCHSRITVGSSGDESLDGPLARVGFFNPKYKPNSAQWLRSNTISPLLSPLALEERTVFVFCRDSDVRKVEEVSTAYDTWYAYARRAGTVCNSTPHLNSPSRTFTRPTGSTTPPPTLALKRDRS